MSIETQLAPRIARIRVPFVIDHMGRVKAADGLERIAERVREQDFSALWYQVESFARRQPGLFLGGAFAAGFALARFVKSATERGGNGGARRWTPAMDLVETDEHFVLRADLPGLTESDVNIELEDNMLTVSGERKAEHESKGEGYYRVERSFGAFSRSLTLPKGVDPEGVTEPQERISRVLQRGHTALEDLPSERRIRDLRLRQHPAVPHRHDPLIGIDFDDPQ
jgi:HSP20 family molecular chaperone IbpA